LLVSVAGPGAYIVEGGIFASTKILNLHSASPYTSFQMWEDC
jgi:hypothetical protein